MGIVGSDQAGSLLQLVLDNEMAAYVKRILRGLDARQEALALPVIEEVGIGGSFLAEPHTRDHFRQQSWFPRLCDRRRWEAWESDGVGSIEDRARSLLSRILAGHKADPCDERLAHELEAITAAAARELG
jgi:trimethylamine--corrinoid protein Co-methyltransferase